MSFGIDDYIVNLKNLPKCDPVYLGQTEDGELHFRECEVTIDGKTRKLELTELLAMALTDRCSVMGVGQLYYFLPVDVIEPTVDLDVFPDVRRKAADLPDLIYMRHNWTKEEQHDWARKPHKNRYIILNGRQLEAEENETSVIPISIAYHRYDSSPRMNLDTACTVMLHLDPLPDFGPTCNILSALARIQFQGHRDMDGCWMNAMEKFESKLPNWTRMNDLDGVVDGLRKLWGNDRNEHVKIDLFDIHQVDVSIAEDLGIRSDMGHNREEEPDEKEDSAEGKSADEIEDE